MTSPGSLSAPSGRSSGFHSLQRQLAALLPGGGTLTAYGGDGGPPLELQLAAAEVPRLIAAAPLEGGTLRARRVFGDPAVGFDAFLDGTQWSKALHYESGVPLVHGTVAAVIRVRRNRRMTTWAHLVARSIYAPRQALPASVWTALTRLASRLVDTTDGEGVPPTAHPFALADAAVHRVQQDRERLEQQLAERWCGVEAGTLFIDGGISGSDRVATARCTVGVVKSHRTLYAEGDSLQTVLGLRQGERSTVFRVTSSKRQPVASWYLRLRDSAGRDPMWGLVRVEVANPDRGTETTIGERADLVSRWVLAEAAPLALPDGRWDKMAYGVRDCEEFLRAVV